jgi:hypothetical protein
MMAVAVFSTPIARFPKGLAGAAQRILIWGLTFAKWMRAAR